MDAALIALIVIAVLVVFVVAKSVTIVPQAQAKVVERLGRYSRTLSPGLALLVPFVDRVRATIDLREQVISFPPQPVITADNLQVGIDTVVYFQVTDPRLAVYGIANYITGMEQLTTTTLRNVVGGLNLEGALTGRDGINSQLRTVLDGTTGPWGLRVARVEIKAIDPPPSIQDSMEKQMRADRDKRAVILTAEGQRQSAITTAEGQKAAAILSAEGKKQAAILDAEAERQSRILRAEGERAALFLQAQGQAKSIETVFQAIHDGKPDQGLLAYQYLQTLPKIAQGDANKMWIVPSEFSKALEGLSKLGGGSDDGDGARSWLDVDASSGAQGATQPPASSLDTSNWFDSNLPPAAEQPEAKISLSSIADTAGETTPQIPKPPPLSQVKQDVQESGPAADPRNRTADDDPPQLP
ncbi:SPFH domain-containing protein [Modestobacter roseus]|uniref:Regulator of protease activity HflC (Stomatin/prohibitin superfamily) n=1 Tax=Modestobacter roseus TaxID=1181884 RepID=A0A562IQD0_9ACTN|nr:SPFH domain-containing protein [Modestobacter roseus]MQA33199.1 SPFH/Band 7/PHB domain protein [Modestobacter roseus]TWH73249.1 regulator of protease activity HflC (stomatin/prohibitin superfamily) [Modestobacter roseus]